jgi:hypothetical protein
VAVSEVDVSEAGVPEEDVPETGVPEAGMLETGMLETGVLETDSQVALADATLSAKSDEETREALPVVGATDTSLKLMTAVISVGGVY